MQLQATASALNRGRGRPSLGPTAKTQPIIRPQSMIFKQQPAGQVLVPANYQLSGNQVFQVGFFQSLLRYNRVVSVRPNQTIFECTKIDKCRVIDTVNCVRWWAAVSWAGDWAQCPAWPSFHPPPRPMAPYR